MFLAACIAAMLNAVVITITSTSYCLHIYIYLYNIHVSLTAQVAFMTMLKPLLAIAMRAKGTWMP